MVNREKILSLIDLTSLNESDTEETIQVFCNKAITPYGHVAALCVFPRFVRQVVQFVAGKPIKVATVANFPQGMDSLTAVTAAIQESIQAGANEIDVVFPYSHYLAGDKDEAYAFIHQCKQVCGEKIILKVILETGALKETDIITEVSQQVLLAGADFLKTSTGKIPQGATLDAAEAMLKVIKDLSPQLNRSLGLKVSGGVRTIAQALDYINLASNIMGTDWVRPAHFRIGASQLVDEVANFS